MNDIQLYLFEADKNKDEAKKTAVQCATKLDSKQLKLIDLVTSLQDYINDKNDGQTRSKSVGFLAEVLENVSSRTLSGQERRLLCDFVLGRLEGDSEGVGASARALLALEERGKWDTETAQRVMRTFMQHTSPLQQFKLQTERFPVIQLMDHLLAKYRGAIHELYESDTKFMADFVFYFEGEKDPRNLMIVFSLLRVPMEEWDIRAHAQDLFEAVFNYFPITFKPPPDDPYGITAQDLKDRLRDCISANSDFAPYSFPGLLDKLDSTSMNTKRDTLQTLQACIQGYRPNTINLYSVALWDALKFEILNVQEEDLANEALTALGLIAVKFSTTSAEGYLDTYLRPIIKECNEHLEDAPTKQSNGAGRILNAIAKTGPAVADKIVRGITPVLMALYNASESIAKRRGLLEIFNQILRAHTELLAAPSAKDAPALQAFASDALETMLRAINTAPKPEVSFRLAALHGVALLTAIEDLLSEREINSAADAVVNLVLHERIEGHGDIRSDAMKALIEMSHTVPESIRNRTIPAFMVELPDVPPTGHDYGVVLEALAQLSAEQQIFDTVVLRLKNKFNAARHHRAPEDYQYMLLLAILYSFTFGSPARESGVIRASYFSDYAEPLMAIALDDPTNVPSAQFLETIGRICNIILRQQSHHFQSSVYNQNLGRFSGNSGSDQKQMQHLAPFLLHYYASLRTEVPDPSETIKFLRTQVSLVTDSPPNPATSVRLLTLLVNKFLEPGKMETLLEDAHIDVRGLLSDQPTPRTTSIAFAIIKALIIQGKCPKLTSQYLELLIEILPTSDRVFAQRFSILLAPDDCLSKENHCFVSGLHRQRLFSQTVPAMVERVRSAEAATKPQYLVAMSGVLRWLPYATIQAALPSLMAPLLQSLDLNAPAEQEVKSAALIVFESTLMHDPAVAADHTAALITRLLNCTAAPANAASVRAKALQCLALLPKQIKREAIVPYRRPVIKRLLECLDDLKRDVRAEAVRCRSAWIAIDEEYDEEEE